MHILTCACACHVLEVMARDRLRKAGRGVVGAARHGPALSPHAPPRAVCPRRRAARSERRGHRPMRSSSSQAASQRPSPNHPSAWPPASFALACSSPISSGNVTKPETAIVEFSDRTLRISEFSDRTLRTPEINVRRMSAVPLPLAWPMEPSTDASEHTPVVAASAVTVCSKEGTRRRLGGAHDSLRKWLDTLREQWPPSFPNTSGGRSRQNSGAGMFGRYARLCPLRRSLPSQRIAPGQTRHTHAECVKSTNASQPRRRDRTHFAALHTHDLAAESRPHTCRIPAAIRWQHEESRIVNPMIPDLAAAAQRLSAAQRTHLRIARSDRTPSPDHACTARREWPSQFHRNGASLLATDATNPRAWRRGSTHPDRCMRGQK
jgi:hypothetical protein